MVLGNLPRDYGPKYVTPEFEAKITLPENSGDGAKLKEDEMMKEFVAKPYPVVNYTAEQSGRDFFSDGGHLQVC